jgi:anti-sigma factor ChrR (cupin superfamily)
MAMNRHTDTSTNCRGLKHLLTVRHGHTLNKKQPQPENKAMSEEIMSVYPDADAKDADDDDEEPESIVFVDDADARGR